MEKNAEDESFVSLVVITVKKDKSVKIALDTRTSNGSCLEKRSHLPNKKRYT